MAKSTGKKARPSGASWWLEKVEAGDRWDWGSGTALHFFSLSYQGAGGVGIVLGV